MIKPLRKIKKTEAILIILTTLIIRGGIMIFVKDAPPHIAVLCSIIVLLIYGLIRGIKYKDMQAAMAISVHSSIGAIYLFFFIGILITALMSSGAIPSLMYYGFYIISAKFFYLSAFLISSIIGIAIGSSLTTVSTIGVALLGISQAFSLDTSITVGAIVSGAFFGDKMSPLSDTTSTAASVVGIDLFTHIKNMTKTTIPVFIISSGIYALLSQNINIKSLENIKEFQESLLATGLVHYYSIIPFILLLLLAILKIDAIVSIIITTIVSIFITYSHSFYSVKQMIKFFFSGFKMEGINQNIASLISRGGISNMFFAITIIILALSLGGLLFSLGAIDSLLEYVEKHIKTKFKATLSVAITATLVNYIVGEQYLSILLSGESFKPIYKKLGMKEKSLARTLEDAGTVINPLVPWSVCGAFITSTLGVSVLSYLPFAIFCYGSLIFTIITGAVSKKL